MMTPSPAVRHGAHQNPGWKQAGGTYQPTQRESDALSLVKLHFDPEDRDTWKYAFERSWFTSAAFYEGIQHVYWNEVTRQLDRHPAPSWRRHFTSNWILPTVLRGVSILLGLKPRVSVAPASAERGDREKADLAREVWSAFWREVEGDRLLRDAAHLAAVTGNAFFKVSWDPNWGKVVGTGSRGQVLKEGRIDLRVVSPWQIYIDPNARSIDESGWLVQETVKSLDTIRREYPERGKYVVAGDESSRTWQQKRLRTLTISNNHPSVVQTKESDRSATVREFWMRPTDKYPKGLHVIFAGDVVLNPKSLENPNVTPEDDRQLQIPYFHVGWAPAVERFWKIGLVEPLIGIQREMNAKLSQLIENVNMCSRPKWLVPKGSGVPATSLTSEPGERIPYNPNFPAPAPMPITPLPNYVFETVNFLKESFQLVSAQNDVTQGQVPGEMRSGVGIQLLKERDESVYAPIRENLWATMARVARACLRMMQRYYEEERTAKILGANGAWKVFRFQGTDLHGATDIRFILDSGLGDSRAARMASIRDLIDGGMIDMMDPNQRKRALQMMDSSALEELISDLVVDENEAEDELTAMTSPDVGDQVILFAKPWQNHEVHMRIKGNYRKTAEYRRLIQEHPEVEYAFTLNLEGDPQMGIIGHLGYIQQAQQAEMEMQAAMKSTPAPKGSPSQPKRPPSQEQIVAAKQMGGSA